MALFAKEFPLALIIQLIVIILLIAAFVTAVVLRLGLVPGGPA